MAIKAKKVKRKAGENARMPRTSPCKFSLAAKASGRKRGKVFAESALGVEIPMVHAYVAKASASYPTPLACGKMRGILKNEILRSVLESGCPNNVAIRHNKAGRYGLEPGDTESEDYGNRIT